MAGVGASMGRVRDRVEARSSGVPFRVKLGLVYAGITVVLVLVFFWFQFDTAFMREWGPFILGGIPLTLFICFGGIALAMVLALFGALGRLSKNAVARGISNFYVSFVRGTPLVVQILFIYFALPQLAFKPSSPEFLQKILIFPVAFAAILALGINYGAYMTEIFRAGIQAVGGGQIEAAHALGMTDAQTTRRVVLPQAVRVIIPPTGNEFIAMLKDSALIGIAASGVELFGRAQNTGLGQNRPFEALALAAAVYWLLTSIFSFFQKRLENRISRGHVRIEGGGH